jgi:hypothetical protein
MGQAEKVSRRTVVQYARDAVDAANHATKQAMACTETVNNQGRLLNTLDKRVTERERAVDSKFNAHTRMVTDVELDLRDLRARLDAFLNMGFFARLAWTLFRRLPAQGAGRGMVSGETPGQGSASSAKAANPHETPRPAPKLRPVGDRDHVDAQALAHQVGHGVPHQ